MCKIIKTPLVMCLMFIVGIAFTATTNDEKIKDIVTAETVSMTLPETRYEPIQLVNVSNPTEGSMVEIGKVSQKDIELIALVTMAEAEGECEKGKRLVIDTILNRMDHKSFPDTIYGVIYQPSQFTSMWNGRVDRCEVREDICQLVREEIKFRINYDCVFFRTGRYSKYGVPMFQVGNHYFSKL